MFRWSLKKYISKKKIEKKEQYKRMLAERTGLAFAEIITGEKQHFPLLKYIVNAMILFFAVYGTLGCFVSAFHLDVSMMIVTLVCLGASIGFSFMYIGKKFRIAMYLLIFAASIAVVGRFYFIINSGVSAIHNICLKRIDAVFDLPQLSEYTEFYTNQYISMTAALCVMVVLFLLLLNIFVSEYMNFVAVFLMTLPFVCFGMYFSFDSSRLPMVCVMGSWLLVYSVRNTNAYNGISRKRESISSVKKKNHKYGFVTDSINVSKIALILLTGIFVLCGGLFLLVPQSNFALELPTNYIKEQTNQGVKNFLSYGFASLFHQDSQRFNPGEISNAKRIRYDGQTDLKVKLVDYNESRIYLRNFVGQTYYPGGYRWLRPEKSEESNLEDKFFHEGAVLQYDYAHNKAVSAMKHKMEVEVVDSRLLGQPLHVPYYTAQSEEKLEMKSDGEAEDPSRGKTATFTFFSQDKPASQSQIADIYKNKKEHKIDENAKKLLSQSRSYYQNNVADSGYLNVPLPNQPVIDEFIKKYNLDAAGEDRINKVIDVLTNEFDYTLEPGQVPYGEDYVNYFLSSSHKGYCVHFASAATLVFRRLGIPARYAEGYVIDTQNFDNAKELSNEKASDWIEGGVLNDGVTVDEVSLSDANGHAWVEIYEQDFGWVPVEVTQASSIDEDGAYGIFGSLLGGGSSVSSATEELMNQVNQIDVENTKIQLQRALLVGLILIIMFYLIRMGVIVGKRHRRFYHVDSAVVISRRYEQLCHILQIFCEQDVTCLSYETFSAMLFNKAGMQENDSVKFVKQLEYVLFAGESITDDSKSQILTQMAQLRKGCIKNMNLGQKINYYFVKILW